MALEIQILGQKIPLKTGSDPVKADRVVSLVNERLKLAESRSRDRVPHHVAVLALLDIAEEYVSAQTQVADHQRKMNEKSRELMELLDVGNRA